MDILRKELNAIYSAQHLGLERLPEAGVNGAKETARTIAEAGNGCAVVTDAACDRCYIYSGAFGSLMGFADGRRSYIEADSSDEDVIYGRIHPEDLVDKRLLEYEFFRLVDSRDAAVKTDFRAVCRIRMLSRAGAYMYISNSTQVIRLSPAGKMWLILCLYGISPDQSAGAAIAGGISPCIVNDATGAVTPLSFDARRRHLLSEREKEVLMLIRQGKPSKQIADILGISVHTVNRHRQNIIARLSVGNSIEAITAAEAMKLL